MIIKSFIFNPMREKCSVVNLEGSKNCLLIDPGCLAAEEYDELRDYLQSKSLTPEALLLTHGHFDHIYGVKKLCKEYGCKVYLSSEDEFTMNEVNGMFTSRHGMENADADFEYVDIASLNELELAGMKIQVLHTPGHTPGGVCFLFGDTLFSGDTLFAGAIGRTDLPGGDYDKLMDSIFTSLMPLPSDTFVIPGHGANTSLGQESATNPFLRPADGMESGLWNMWAGDASEE